MIKRAMYTTIITLWKHVKNKTQISKVTGCDWKTVDKVICRHEKGEKFYGVKEAKSSLEPYKSKIEEFLERNMNGRRIHEELLEMGIKISYSAVKRYISKITANNNVCIRFHTLPGKEAQVDFAYVGKFPDDNGVVRKTYAFCMTLGYSRYSYSQMVFDQKVETFLRCHIEAFKYFGGVPHIIKIDNLKSGVIESSFYEPIIQEQYNNFSKKCGFDPIPCKVRSPQEKGKVESGVKYIQSSFINGRSFESKRDLDAKLRDWLDNKCNKRIHGTTRRVPEELFNLEEKNLLKPLPDFDITVSNIFVRKVQKDCHILINYNYYSVPAKYSGMDVHAESDGKVLRIMHGHNQIAIHEIILGRGKFSTYKSHYPDYKLPANKAEYKRKFEELGKNAYLWFEGLLSNRSNDWYKLAAGVYSLSKHYDKEIVDLACKRARFYNVYSYRQIYNICQQGLYAMPLDTNTNTEEHGNIKN